jgi:hypothetical protein
MGAIEPEPLSKTGISEALRMMMGVCKRMGKDFQFQYLKDLYEFSKSPAREIFK